MVFHDAFYLAIWYWFWALFLTPGNAWRTQSVLTVLVNQLVWTPLVIVLALPYFEGKEVPHMPDSMDSESMFSYFVWRMLQLSVQFAIVYFIESVSFYAFHRLLHHRWLYRFHKRHHKWKGDVAAYSAIDAHPVDYVLTNALPLFLGPILVGWPVHYMFYWACLGILNGLWSHKNTSTFHATHHVKQNVNFGVDGWLDRWMGTHA